MNELLLKRIERKLQNLSDEQGYRVLDYVEFLESKYGTGERPPTLFERVAEGVEDTMRVTRIPAAAIRGTMGAIDGASRLMERLAEAGRSAVEELGKTMASAGEETEGEAGGEAGGEASPAGADAPDDAREPPASA